MSIVIRRLTTANLSDLNRCDNSFVVDAELSLRVEDGRISYTVLPVEPYVKRYDPENHDAHDYLDRPDHAAWLAYVDDELTGQILVRENWNRFALLWDIAVNPPFRRRGVGSRLMEQAIRWARERGLPGMMLETQNINAGACRLYERCGFVLKGFDTGLYLGVMPQTREIALFWYLLF